MTDKKRLLFEKKCPDALAIYDSIITAPKTHQKDCPDFLRASGWVKCRGCGKAFYDHPRHPFFSFITITCSDGFCKL